MGWAGSLLGNRSIVRCETAWAVSTLGTWTFTIVLALYAYYDQGPAGVGLAVAARMLPAAVLADLPAAVRSRWSDRTAVLASALARFLVLEAIALTLSAGAPFALLLALTGAFEIAGGAHRSARADLVLASARRPGDVVALGAARLVTSIGFLVGAAVSAVIVVLVNLEAAFAVAGVAFLVVAAIAWWFPADHQRVRATTAAERIERGRIAARSVSRQPWMRFRVALAGAVALVDSTLDLLLVIIALELLHTGDSGVGWLRAAFACGGLIGVGIAARSLRRGRLAGGATVGLVLAGAPLALVVAWKHPLPAIVLVALLGGGYALFDYSLELLTHRLVPADAAGHGAVLRKYVDPITRAAGAGLGTWLVLDLGDDTAIIIIALLLPIVALLAAATLHRAEDSVTIPTRVLTLLEGLPLLHDLPPSGLENLALSAVRDEFPRGAVILEPGRPNDRMFVVDTGSVDASEDHRLEHLGTGGSFGESGILPAGVQAQRVLATVPVATWSITRADLLAALGGEDAEPRARPARAAAALEPEPAPLA